MYKSALRNIEQLASRIREGKVDETRKEMRKPRRGIMSRLDTDPVEEEKEEKDDTADRILQRYLSIKAANEDLISQIKSSEMAPEFSSRPRGRGDVQFSDPTLASKVITGLTERGLPQHVAVAFAVNMQDESGLVADRVEDEPNVHGTRGKGYYQLTGARREQFEDMYGDDWSHDNQLDFLVYEINNTEKSAGEAILATSTVGDAAVAIVNKFLRPAEKHRIERSNRYANLDLGGLNLEE